MLALKISVDHELPIIAGARDLAVLALNVGCNADSERVNARRAAAGQEPIATFDLTAIGVTARPDGIPDAQLNWIEVRPLQTGQIVTVEIIDTTQPSECISAKPAKRPDTDERAHFEHCKRTYLALKDQYDLE